MSAARTMRMADLSGVTPEQWRRIRARVATGAPFQPDELAVGAGISRVTAIAVMGKLAGLGAGRLQLVAYHRGEDTPTAVLPYENGPDGLVAPLRCRVCDEDLEPEDLIFDVRILLEGEVAFE
jgi:hypothetical protein